MKINLVKIEEKNRKMRKEKRLTFQKFGKTINLGLCNFLKRFIAWRKWTTNQI